MLTSPNGRRAKPSQHGLWDSLWEGLAQQPLGEANNKPTDNRHFCCNRYYLQHQEDLSQEMENVDNYIHNGFPC